jgi:hypothetical protein
MPNDLLCVYLVRSTVNEERYGELRYVAADDEKQALELCDGTFDYDDIAEHVEKTEMLYRGEAKLLFSIYLG